MVYRGGYLVLWRTERKECWRAFRRGKTTNLDRWSPAPRGLNRRSRHLFGRVLDASVRAVQGTSSDTLLAADMEEIVRRAEETITNRMSMFQQPAPMGWDAQWYTQQSSVPGPAWGAPPADVVWCAGLSTTVVRAWGTGIYLQDYQAQHQQLAAALLDITLIINKQA